MGFDMNSGYSGWSMSRNAVAAYRDGEMPKSKWTKKAILAALEDYQKRRKAPFFRCGDMRRIGVSR